MKAFHFFDFVSENLFRNLTFDRRPFGFGQMSAHHTIIQPNITFCGMYAFHALGLYSICTSKNLRWTRSHDELFQATALVYPSL